MSVTVLPGNAAIKERMLDVERRVYSWVYAENKRGELARPLCFNATWYKALRRLDAKGRVVYRRRNLLGGYVCKHFVKRRLK